MNLYEVNEEQAEALDIYC